MRYKKFHLTGVVQGVGFRYFVKRHANAIGAGGWVCNNRDGSLTAVVAGSESQVQELSALIQRGPNGSRVLTCDELPVTEADKSQALTPFTIH